MVAFFARPRSHDKSLVRQREVEVDAGEQPLHPGQHVIELFDDAPECEGAAWTHEMLAPMLVEWGKANGFKTGTVMWPVRIALSGLASTPGGATEIAQVLGREETLQPLRAALARLALRKPAWGRTSRCNSLAGRSARLAAPRWRRSSPRLWGLR